MNTKRAKNRLAAWCCVLGLGGIFLSSVPQAAAGKLSETASLRGSWQEVQEPASDQQSQPEPQEEDAKTERQPIYDEKADAAKDIAAALSKAKRENRRVLIQWGGNWCGWCFLLHDKMSDSRPIAQKLNYEYDVVLVDIGNLDKHQDLVKKYAANLEKEGVPYLTVLDADGNVLSNQETSSLEEKDAEGKPGHSEERVLALLTKHQAPARDAQEILAAGKQRAAKADKLVFLHFGAPWCGWCHHLEAWMLEPQVAAILNRVFVDVKVDTDRMTGGEDLLASMRDKPSGIPWFVFLDPQTGQAVVTSESADGNLGFPSTDQEIAHFIEMLKRCGERFSEEDCQTLEKSLVANREKREAARAAK